MPEVIDAYGHQMQGWQVAVLFGGIALFLWGAALYRVYVLEGRSHVEALERIRLLDGASRPDNGSSGDDNHVGVGDVVRAEKER